MLRWTILENVVYREAGRYKNCYTVVKFIWPFKPVSISESSQKLGFLHLVFSFFNYYLILVYNILLIYISIYAFCIFLRSILF